LFVAGVAGRELFDDGEPVLVGRERIIAGSGVGEDIAGPRVIVEQAALEFGVVGLGGTSFWRIARPA